MKKIIRTAAFLTFLAVAATSCQKDNTMLNAESTQPGSQVQYVVEGATHTVFLTNDEEWSLFLDNVFAMARNGYTVEIKGNSNSAMKYKETITYTTTIEGEAKDWTTYMLLQGYDVSISYDDTTGVYTCIAQR